MPKITLKVIANNFSLSTSTVSKSLKDYELKLAKERLAIGKSVFRVIYAGLDDSDNTSMLFKESFRPNKKSLTIKSVGIKK